MMNLRQIERLVDHAGYRRLIQRLLSEAYGPGWSIRSALNGCPEPRVVACALALRRCCELTYQPDALARRLAATLLYWLECHDQSDTLAPEELGQLAIVCRGLLEYRNQLEQTRSVDPVEQSKLGRIMTRALRQLGAAIAARWAESGAEDTDLPMLAVVLWQLGDQPDFRERVDLSRLAAHFRGAGRTGPAGELAAYAFAQAA